MSNFPEVFISSAHFGLEDLRGALQQDLAELGITALLSSDKGFPARQTPLPPYVQCIKVLEECSMVVGIIDKRYGTKFTDWKKYKTYSGLSPTHGELRHAIKKQIPLNVFVRKDLWGLYQSYRENKLTFSPPKGYDLESFKMLEEIKTAKVAPWIEPFDDVRDITKALRLRLIGYMSDGLALQHKLNERNVRALQRELLKLNPKSRKALEHIIKNNPKALSMLSPSSALMKSRASTKLASQPPTNLSQSATSNSLDIVLAASDITSAIIRLWRSGK